MNQRIRFLKKSNHPPCGRQGVGLVFAIAVLIFAIASTSRAAFAGDASAPNGPPTAGQAYCNAIGEGFYAVAGSNACIKISGYVAAGVDFVVPRARTPSPFAAKSSSGADSQTAVSAEVRLDTPLGPGRLYVQIGHDAYRP